MKNTTKNKVTEKFAMRSHLQSRRRRGQSLLEFALVVPVLLVILLGIIEFGWYIKNQLTISNATREGARIASIGKTQSEIKDRIKNSAKPLVLTDTNITLQQSTNNGSSYGAFPADDNTVTPAMNGVERPNLIKVQVQYTHRTLTNFPVLATALNNKVITIAVTMVRE
jgi:Flp pilus assembly protein TadG